MLEEAVRQAKCNHCKRPIEVYERLYNAGDYLENISISCIRFIAINDGYDSAMKKEMEQTLIFKSKGYSMTSIQKIFLRRLSQLLQNWKSKANFLLGIHLLIYMKDPNDKYNIIIDEKRLG